jgi:acyl-CoA synthetase (AMP-forming)/AMP-acid ligase II
MAVIYSGGPLEGEIPDLDYASFTLHRAKELGDKPALIDGPSGRALSYADLDRSVRSLAAGLSARGFASGDMFAICLPNVPDYAVAFHGVLAAGGRVTTASPLYTARELGHQLADSRAKMLLTAPPFLDVARQAAAQAGHCEVIVLGEAAGVPSFSELLGDPGAARDVGSGPAGVVVILYSSGTTGLSKGVMLSHRNLVANALQCQALVVPSCDDVLIAALPFFHVYGLAANMNAGPRAGATIVTMPRYTGDLATAGQDGWLTIADRVEELIHYRGFQVAPAVLEAILLTHPQVADCAVIGVPDPEAGQAPKVFVVPAGDDFDASDVVAGQVAPYKRIRLIECVPEIPKSPSGKVLRRLLRPPDRLTAKSASASGSGQLTHRRRSLPGD